MREHSYMAVSLQKYQTFLFHLIFWLVLFAIMVYSGRSELSTGLAVTTSAVNLLFFGLIVYFNATYLFPRYVRDKKLFLHLIWILLASALLTPVKTLSLYYVATGNARLQAYYLQNEVYIFISTFFIGLSATIYKVMTEWVIQQRERQELETKTLQSELNFLKSQINPHFLFNTLNSLYALTLKKSDQAPEMVLRLSEMMRYMLYECNEKFVPLQKELSYLEHYIELEKLRYGERVDIVFSVVGSADKKTIAPLIFIPFLENAFKHGINQQIEKGFVHLNIQITLNKIELTLTNSKPASGPRTGKQSVGGIGLLNVRRRMEILYPEQHALSIETSPTSFRIHLTLPAEVPLMKS